MIGGKENDSLFARQPIPERRFSGSNYDIFMRMKAERNMLRDEVERLTNESAATIKEMGAELARVKQDYHAERAYSRANYERFKRASEDCRQLQGKIEQLRARTCDVEIEMVLKTNYISMFVRRGWIPEDTAFVYQDYKRVACTCTVKRDHLESLRRYATYLKEI